MIREFYIEQVNPNDTELSVVERFFEDGELVNEGDLIFVVEGQKTAIDVEAESDGYLYSVFNEGDIINIENIAYGLSEIEKSDEVINWLDSQKKAEPIVEIDEDTEPLPQEDSAQELVALSSSKVKVAVLPGGKAFRQVEDALIGSSAYDLVGFFDDNKRDFPGCIDAIDFKKISGYVNKGAVDRVFVACGDAGLRATLLNQLQQHGIRTINVIHPTAEISRSATIGNNVYIGPKVVVSSKAYIDNGAFISSLSNVEHHCIVGQNTLFGPGVMLSGSVSIGKNVVLGAGVSVESNIEVQDNVYVAPGFGVSQHLKEGERILK